MSEMFTEKELVTLELVKRNKELEPYFFQKLCANKDVKWMSLLKERGFFDRGNIPVLIEGAFVDQWNVLNYIISIIDQVIVLPNNNTEYILEIILQASEISHNFRVYEQCINILSHIPPDKYKDSYFEELLNNLLNDDFALEHTLYYLEKNLLSTLAKGNGTKSFILFKNILERSKDLKGDRLYIIEELISNDEIIINLTRRNYDKTVGLLISLLQDELYKSSSVREIQKKNIKIDNIKDKYLIFIEDVKILEENFINRNIDIEKIKYSVKQYLGNVDEEELDRVIKLLYGDLFIEESFESIFFDKEHFYEIHDYLAILIKKSLMNNCDSLEETLKLLEVLLNSNYDFIKKIALFIIAEQFEKLEDFIIKQILEKTTMIDYIFRYYIFEDEVKHIFENIKEPDSKVIEIIDSIIDKGEYIKHDWDFEYSDIWNQKRYFALKNVPYFNRKYEEMKLKTGIETKLRAPISIGEFKAIEQKSPLTKEEILQISNQELVKNMLQFRPSRNFSESYTQLSYEGYGKTLKEVIMAKPERFINDLSVFDKVQYDLVYFVIDAFKELIRENKPIDFIKIIKFVNLYTNSESFWNDSYCYELNRDYCMAHSSILKNIFWLIIEYLSSENHSIGIEEYDEIIKLSVQCYNNGKLNTIEDVLFSNNDYDFYSLNSLAGIFIRMLIELVLKLKKCKVEDDFTKWENDIKPIYQKCLEDGCIDAHFYLGQLIGNLTYIDKAWVLDNLKSISYSNNLWEFFISGYLYSRTIYGDYHKLLKKDLNRALEYEFADKDIKGRLAEHITFAYLNGFDDEDSIFYNMLSMWENEMIEKAIRICQSIDKKSFVKEASLESVKLRTLELWNNIVSRYKDTPVDKLSNNDIKIIRQAANLLNNFNNIDKNLAENVRFSFKFLKNDFYSYSYVEFFKKVLNNQIGSKVSQDLMDLTCDFLTNCLPTYPEEEIKEILKFIKTSSQSEDLISKIMQAYMENSNGNSYIVKYISSELLNNEEYNKS